MDNFSYITELKDDITHVIVSFGTWPQSKKLCIDLVPKEWLSKLKRTWRCKYPPKSEYNKIEEWSKERKPPQVTWKEYNVKLLKGATNFEQGQRRMSRLSENTILFSSEVSEIDATEMEDTESETEVSSVISDSELQKLFDKQNFNQKNASVKENVVSSTSTESLVTLNKQKELLTTQHSRNKRNNKRKSTEENVDSLKHKKLHDTGKNEFMTTVGNQCCEQMKELIQKKMESIKKSILYDIRKSFQELQNNLIFHLTQEQKTGLILDTKDSIGITLPICELNNFKTLESLIEEADKRDALYSFLKRHVDVAQTHRKAIHNTLSAIMDKNVQIEFTAFGKQKNEIKKLNFSKTKLYILVMNILISKFGSKEEKDINSYMSR